MSRSAERSLPAATGGGGPAPSSLGTPTLISTGSYGPGGTNWGVAAGAAVPVGYTICAVGQVNTADLTGLGDDAGNTWAVDTKTTYSSTGPFVGFLGHANTTTALTSTTNVNFYFTNGGSGSGTMYFEADILTWTGTSTVLGTPQSTSGTSVTALSLSQASVPAGALVIASLGIDGGAGTITYPAGWVSLGDANYLPLAYLVTTASGTVTADFSWTTAVNAQLCLAVFT